MDNVLFLITARSGSKGVKDKNIKEIFDIPLLAIRGLSALKLTSNENIWLSTDSKKYAEIGEKYNLSVPFLRPKELANDKCSSNDVVLHAMRFAKKLGKKFDFIALLEPTSPFVYYEDLKMAIEQLEKDTYAAAIIATKIVETSTVFVQKNTSYLSQLATNIDNLTSHRRQDVELEITPSGGFYISRWNDFLEKPTFYKQNTLSYILPDESCLEIDSEIQLEWAYFLAEKKIAQKDKIL